MSVTSEHPPWTRASCMDGVGAWVSSGGQYWGLEPFAGRFCRVGTACSQQPGRILRAGGSIPNSLTSHGTGDRTVKRCQLTSVSGKQAPLQGDLSRLEKVGTLVLAFPTQTTRCRHCSRNVHFQNYWVLPRKRGLGAPNSESKRLGALVPTGRLPMSRLLEDGAD